MGYKSDITFNFEIMRGLNPAINRHRDYSLIDASLVLQSMVVFSWLI